MVEPSINNRLIEALISYLPPAVARAIHANPHAPVKPRAARFHAAVLLADVSGFTVLTEKLAARGPAGAEEMTLLLNRYFSSMIGLLEHEGGEVVQFSGDALIAVFPIDEVVAESVVSRSLPVGDERQIMDQLQISVRRAWQAATRMQTAMAEFATLSTSVGSVALGMKIAIGAGEVLGLSVGGVFDRWQYIIAGEPLAQVAEAEHIARRGEIVLSPEARGLLIDQPVAPRPRAPLRWTNVSEQTTAALRTHIPGAITYRLVAGQADWLAEMRPMTVLFLGIGGLQYNGPAALDQIQATMLAFQQTVYRYEGSINKLLVDDKGAISLVLFGAPPLSHLDDPLRAVRCALELQEVGERLGLGLAIGVTTGQVVAGPVGSSSRREYTVIGDTVNLAARLMQAAGRGGVHADYATFHAARGEVEWQELPPQMVKGKAAAVRIYRPLGRYSSRSRSLQQPEGERTALAGRTAEVARIGQALSQSLAGRLCVLCLEGEPGIGKSRLVLELARQLREHGLVGLLGRGQAIEQQTPYRAWQEIFSSYFDLESVDDSAAQRQRVLEQLAEIAPALVDRAPLLNDLLGLGLPETTLTEHLEPKLRQASLQALLIDLLGMWAAERPLVLVLEDAQWLDSLSWQLALQVARGLTDLPVLLVLALRPLEHGPFEQSYHALCALAWCERLALSPLGPSETVELAAARLGVAELPPPIAKLIEQRAGGSPFVAEELALSLRDSGTVEVVDGRAVLNAERDELRLPDTVQGLVLSRIDRLPAEQQLTLKVASVIGRAFGHSTLLDVYPGAIEEPELRSNLDRLGQSDMVLQLEVSSALRSHMFKQVIVQEATYSTLLLAQRRDLHERVAGWYELLAEDQTELYPLLAYHWRQAQRPAHELRYATLAAKKLAAEYANDEALSYLNRALELTSDRVAQYDLIWLRAQIHERIGDTAARREDLARLEALLDTQSDHKRADQVYNAWAAFYRDISDYPAATAALERALAAAQQAHDPAGEARSLTIWGQVMEYQGAYREAQGYFEQTLTLYRQLNYPRGEATNLSHLGNIHYYLGSYHSAREYDLQALAIWHMIGDRPSEARSLINLSQVSLQLGEFDSARQYQQQALQIARATGDRNEEARTLATMGEGYLVQGSYDAAKQHLEQAIRLFQSVGERRREANCLNVLGMVWRDVGHYAQARTCFEQSLAIQVEIGEHSYASYTYLNLGLVLLQDNDAAAAGECYQQAFELARTTGNRDAEAYTLSYRAALHEHQGAWGAAAADYQVALPIREELRATAAAIEDRAGLARVALAQGRQAEARAHADACIAYLEAHGSEGMEFSLAVYMTCCDVLYAGGDAAAAEQLHEQARALLLERAAAIGDPTLRQSMLENVAINRRVLANGQAT
jgi:class 3 adenylate cyclase/predicted ATPase